MKSKKYEPNEWMKKLLTEEERKEDINKEIKNLFSNDWDYNASDRSVQERKPNNP